MFKISAAIVFKLYDKLCQSCSRQTHGDIFV